MYVFISHILSACVLYVHMYIHMYMYSICICVYIIHIVLYKHLDHTRVQSLPWSTESLYIYIPTSSFHPTGVSVLFPGSKNITKRWLFKVVWPKGHDLLKNGTSSSPKWWPQRYPQGFGKSTCWSGPKPWTSQFKLKTAENKNEVLIKCLPKKLQKSFQKWLDKFINLENPSFWGKCHRITKSSKWLSHQQSFSINTEFKGSWSLLYLDILWNGWVGFNVSL